MGKKSKKISTPKKLKNNRKHAKSNLKQQKKVVNPWKLYSITALLLALLGVFFYRHLVSYFFDSSLNGSETREIHQYKIPHDVQLQIDKNKREGVLSQGIRVPILMYHYIEYVDPDDKIRASLTTSPYVLEEQIKSLQENGYTFMTVGELSNVLERKTYLPEKPILLTFDDGYRDFYKYAYPILKKYNVKATQYVISGFLGNPNHLLSSQVQEIASENLVEIGAHTVHHAWLKDENEKTAFHEIYKSKIDLEKLIKKPVVSFAYPYGAFDLSAIEQVKEAGFLNAVSTIPGIIQRAGQHEYFLYRLRPGGKLGQDLIVWLEHTSFPTDKP